jgi:DNA primase
MFFSEGDDPDSRVRKLGTEQFKQQLKQSVFLSDYLLDSLGKKVDLRSVEGRARLVEIAKPFLQQLSFSNYRQLLLQALSERSGINVEKLTILNQDRKKTTRPSTPSQQQSITGWLNPVPKMIRFLLYKPALAKQVQDIQELTAIKEPGINLLIELLEFIKKIPYFRGIDGRCYLSILERENKGGSQLS